MYILNCYCPLTEADSILEKGWGKSICNRKRIYTDEQWEAILADDNAYASWSEAQVC